MYYTRIFPNTVEIWYRYLDTDTIELVACRENREHSGSNVDVDLMRSEATKMNKGFEGAKYGY